MAQCLLITWTSPEHHGGSEVSAYRLEMRCSPSNDAAHLTAAAGSQDSLALTSHFLSIYRCALWAVLLATCRHPSINWYWYLFNKLAACELMHGGYQLHAAAAAVVVALCCMATSLVCVYA